CFADFQTVYFDLPKGLKLAVWRQENVVYRQAGGGWHRFACPGLAFARLFSRFLTRLFGLVARLFTRFLTRFFWLVAGLFFRLFDVVLIRFQRITGLVVGYSA